MAKLNGSLNRFSFSALSALFVGVWGFFRYYHGMKGLVITPKWPYLVESLITSVLKKIIKVVPMLC